MLLKKERSVGRRVANYYFGIKITSKLDQTHQSIGNSLSMLLEYKEDSRKKSSKLLFWNKNNIKTCSNMSIKKKLTLCVVKQREVSRKKSDKLLVWNKNKIKTCSNTLNNRKLTSYDVRIIRGQ